MNKSKLRFVLLTVTATLCAGSLAAGTITFGPSGLGPAVPDATDYSGTHPGSLIATTITIPGGNYYVINPGNSVTVTLTGLNHTFMSDLEIKLTGPAGSPVFLFDQTNGGCNFLPGNTYSFNSGSPAMTTCTNLASGSYAARPGFSSAWSGLYIDNTQWTLSIQDFVQIDTQSAGWRWSMSVDANPVPEPATIATSFAGIMLAYAACRRRRRA